MLLYASTQDRKCVYTVDRYCYVMLLCYVILYYIILCYLMCYGMLCYLRCGIMLCYVTLRYVTLRYVMYYVMLSIYVIFQVVRRSKLLKN